MIKKKDKVVNGKIYRERDKLESGSKFLDEKDKD